MIITHVTQALLGPTLMATVHGTYLRVISFHAHELRELQQQRRNRGLRHSEPHHVRAESSDVLAGYRDTSRRAGRRRGLTRSQINTKLHNKQPIITSSESKSERTLNLEGALQMQMTRQLCFFPPNEGPPNEVKQLECRAITRSDIGWKYIT